MLSRPQASVQPQRTRPASAALQLQILSVEVRVASGRTLEVRGTLEASACL